MAGSVNLHDVASNVKCVESLSSFSVGAFPSGPGRFSPKVSLVGGLRGAAPTFSIDTRTQAKLRIENGPCSSSPQNLNLNNRRPQRRAFERGDTGILRMKEGLICSALAPTSTEEQKEYDWDSPKMKDMMAFLEKDLVHLFDEQGIDKSMYDKKVDFKDPITKYSSLDGYLFNILFLRKILTPEFELHSVKQTGPRDITTRWTMTMYFTPLPWRPQLIFTGTSVMSVNEETGKFCRHIDYWDSVQNNEYLSFEAVADLFKQLRIYKTPDLETPQFRTLKRTSKYEVRRYEQFVVAETSTDKVVGIKGFNAITGFVPNSPEYSSVCRQFWNHRTLALEILLLPSTIASSLTSKFSWMYGTLYRYLFGKNSEDEKMKMTTPVFTQSADDSFQLQVVLPLNKRVSSAPSPLSEEVKIKPVEKIFAAAVRFSGETDEDTVKEKERLLRAALIEDKLQAEEGFLLARFNDPGRTWPFMRRNEVIIWLKDYILETE